MRCSLLTLSTYLDSELDASKAGELEAHLISCRRCSTGLENIRNETTQVGALAGVRIPDYSALGLLQSLGLIPPDGDLPDAGPGGAPPDAGDDDELPAWMHPETETEVTGGAYTDPVADHAPADADLRGHVAPAALPRSTPISPEARA